MPNTAKYQVTVENDSRVLVDGVPAYAFFAIDTPEPYVQTFTVTGQVSPVVYYDQGFGPEFLLAFAITAQILNTSCQTLYATMAEIVDETAIGPFTFTNIPPGSYILYLHRPGYLARTMAFTVSAGGPSTVTLEPPDGPVFTLKPGDVNGDGVVDMTDINLIDYTINTFTVPGFGEPGYDPAMDLNATGRVNVADIVVADANLCARASDYPGFAGCVPRV